MMTETHRQNTTAAQRGRLPSAVIKKSRRSWLLWLIPAGALCLCGWFVYRDYVSMGPTITILFDNTEGLEAKNTVIKYRGADVGMVKSISLTKDSQRVKISAQLAGSARNLARSGSVFWIVRPELKMGSFSGLRTIVSGEYITVKPGTGVATNLFVGSETEPITERSNALRIIVLTTNLGSVQEGTPLFYRGIQVGEVLYYQLGADARKVIIHASVWEEYAPLVRPDSKFWNAGGISIRGGLFKGIQISAESPKNIISGGIEFATPPDSPGPATNGTVFNLNEKPDDKWRAWAPEIPLHLPPEANQTNAQPQMDLK
jgi:paraquat-inducible protein B